MNRTKSAGELLDYRPRGDLVHEAVASAVGAAELLTRVDTPRRGARGRVLIRRQIGNRSRTAAITAGSPPVAVQLADDSRAHEALDICLDRVDVHDFGLHDPPYCTATLNWAAGTASLPSNALGDTRTKT
jgi:hypothetical protein